MELTGHAEREKLKNIVESIFRKQGSRNFLGVTHRSDEASPDVVNMRFGLELTDTPNDLCSGEQRVVGLVRLRAMTRSSPHSDPDSEESLFAHKYRQFQAVGAGQWNTARFGDDVVGHDRIALMVDEVVGAVHAI